jgi:uncharacterized protein (DUF433 family)
VDRHGRLETRRVSRLQYKWIVRDPHLLGGKLAVSFVLSCLAEGMNAEEIRQTYGPFPDEAISEIMKVAAGLLDSSHVAA